MQKSNKEQQYIKNGMPLRGCGLMQKSNKVIWLPPTEYAKYYYGSPNVTCKHNTTLPNTQVFGEEFVTFFCESEKLVTPCSLRLGFDLLREKNCIELRPILWRCKVRDRENLAGSAPQYPLLANHLIQKKESISRLLGICDSGGNGNLSINPHIHTTFIKHQEPMVTYQSQHQYIAAKVIVNPDFPNYCHKILNTYYASIWVIQNEIHIIHL